MARSHGPKIVRVELVRRIALQGTETWVQHTLDRMLQGTFEMGPNRFIVGYPVESSETVPPDPNIRAELTIHQHREFWAKQQDPGRGKEPQR